jgi:hypothetical protein
MPVIPATQEAEIGKIAVPGQSRQLLTRPYFKEKAGAAQEA